MAQVLRHRHPVSDSFAPRHQRAILSSRSRSGQTSELSTTSIPFIDPHQVLVKTSHVALNAYDGQSYAGDDLKVLGRDGVGLVAAIGSSVTRLKVGQRIWFCSNSSLTGSGAFQDYSVHNSSEVGILPDDLSDEGGAALGSGLLTAGVALFGTLGLQLPSTTAPKVTLSEVEGPWFLVWGGAGITGVYMIQLAKLCGYRVICAASPLNHAYVQSLGAEVVLDRWKDEEELVHAIRSATADNVVIAVDNVGCRTAGLCLRILQGSKTWNNGSHWQQSDNCQRRRLLPIAGNPEVLETETEDSLRKVDLLRISFSSIFYGHPDFSERLLDTFTSLLINQSLRAARVRLVKGGYEGILSTMKDFKDGLSTGGFKLVAKIEDRNCNVA